MNEHDPVPVPDDETLFNRVARWIFWISLCAVTAGGFGWFLIIKRP